MYVLYSMTPFPSPLSLLSIFALLQLIQAQCVTSGYVLCLPAGSELGGIPQDDFVNPDLWDSLQEAAMTSIDDGAILRRDLVSRQDALCCAPTDKCLVVTDSNTPFCFVSTRKCSFLTKRSSLDHFIRNVCANLLKKKKNTDTTRYVFSDQSFGYVSNGTYYAADGTLVDYAAGYYSSTDGSTGTFAPATATAMSSGAGAGATSSTATKATSAVAKGSESHTSATTSPVKGTQQTVAPTPTTTTTGSRSDSTTVMPSSSIRWLGLYLASLTVFLAL